MTTVIVGAGAVGLATAYELIKAGDDVVVVDAAAAGQGASHGNAAKIAVGECGPVPAPGVLLQGIKWMLRPDSPLSVKPSLAPSYLKFMFSMARHCNERDFRKGLELTLRLAEDANDLLDEYVEDGLEFEMHERGVLLAFETKERLEEQATFLPVWEKYGYPAERLNADEVRQKEPALTERIRYGLSFPTDRQLDPDTLTSALVTSIRSAGGKVVENVTVDDFGVSGGKVTAVSLSNGDRLLCDSVVLAAGVAVRPLAHKLGVNLPIHPGKGYSIDYTAPPVDLKTSLTLEDARVAVTPLNGFLRFAGTMEFGSYKNNVSAVRVEAIRRAARENIRGWAAAEADGPDGVGERAAWAGMRPMTPDGLPVVGRLHGPSNTYIAGGHGMLGLTLAPGTGKYIADLITGRKPRLDRHDQDLISPARYL